MATDSSVEEREGIASLLEGIHEQAGARFQEGPGSVVLPRHYGDPASEYEAATGSCAVSDRSHRARWRLEGRDPARMLNGIVTNTIPDPLESLAEFDSTSTADHEGTDDTARWRLVRGRAPYGLTLTAKGKVVSDHRLSRLPGGDGDVFLLQIPAEGVAGMKAHFERFLPPRFATVVDLSRSTGMLSVVGPDAAASLATAIADATGAIDPSRMTDRLDHLEEGESLHLVPSADGEESGDFGYLVISSGDLGSRGAEAPEVLDVTASREALRELWGSLVERGCAPLGRAAWDTLRVEGGRPAFGADMDEDTIPVEAGVHDRAIDYEKGCYTGQEVIVRIRDRGRVNRHLRRLLLGAGPTPPEGTALFREDGEREVGRITSAVESPRFGQSIALGYVRRELEPPARVLLGSSEGRVVEVRVLDGDEGDGNGS